MRLTLRTLLAYRDGVLEPSDATLLEKKIVESNTARQISNRIDEAMINGRIAPIPVDAREFGFDANLVAQFLDDTIPVETLPQMERTCLESNALLGEIGCCHQILSYAVSVPAHVPGALRERIHTLSSTQPALPAADEEAPRYRVVGARTVRIDETPASKRTGSVDENGSESGRSGVALHQTISDLRKTGIELSDGLGKQVPEYLTGMDRRWMQKSALFVAMVVGLLYVGSKAIGPTDTVRKLWSASVPNPQRNMAPVIVDPADAANRAQGTALVQAQPSVGRPDSHESESADTINDEIIESDVGAPPPGFGPPGIGPPTNHANSSPSASPPSVAELDAHRTNKVGAQWLPESKQSSEAIVLRWDPRSASPQWNRAVSGESIPFGTRLVVPPAMRTEFRFEPGIQWVVAGETDLNIELANGLPMVRLFGGRALVSGSPDGQEIQIAVGDHAYGIRFLTNEASCAIQVSNTLEPFEGPNVSELVPSQILPSQIMVSSRIQWVVLKDQIELRSIGGIGTEPRTLHLGERVFGNRGTLTTAEEIKEVPWWFRTNVERPIDQLAANDLQRGLTGVTPDPATDMLKQELRQFVNHRKPETAALVERTRMVMGDYDLLFTPDSLLNRRTAHSHWQSLVQQLPQSLGRAENRDRFLLSLQDTAKDRTGKILSLIVPKTNEQLEAGADKLLVETLNAPAMDERVLAFFQLSQITGKSFGYHPDKHTSESLNQWRKALGKGEIRLSEKLPSTGGRP